MVKSSQKVIASKGKSGGSKAPKAVPLSCLTVSDGERQREVSVRKIDNGYIIRESTYGGRGPYKSVERFSPTAPKIDVPKMPKAKK
jgi:hypothetical protein